MMDSPIFLQGVQDDFEEPCPIARLDPHFVIGLEPGGTTTMDWTIQPNPANNGGPGIH